MVFENWHSYFLAMYIKLLKKIEVFVRLVYFDTLNIAILGLMRLILVESGNREWEMGILTNMLYESENSFK